MLCKITYFLLVYELLVQHNTFDHTFCNKKLIAIINVSWPSLQSLNYFFYYFALFDAARQMILKGKHYISPVPQNKAVD